MNLLPAEDAHFQLLTRWRGAMDLVGPGPLKPHFIDAIGAVEGLTVSGRWADLGSGAGFPGVSLAAHNPDASVLLVESRQKRAVFLNQVIAAAMLSNATVLRQRVETLEGGLDGVISRAYKPPLRYLDDAEKLLRPGGQAVVMLGDGVTVDLPAVWELVEEKRYQVSDGWRIRLVARLR
ncbi:MAG: 16S rRNA (guanine527-N7)-methyltransferase [Myxococcota bacterium]|jgi:16S rRNA (guanine527-N7)-methyltransferase